MATMKRAVHVDFHTMPGIYDIAEGFDGESFAQTLQDAHVTYVNVFGRCNIGFSYYPTKIGTVYPGLKQDLLGDMIKACHKRDIGVTAYLNGGLNHQLMFDRPEFMRIDGKGRVYEENPVYNHYYRAPCFNTGYRQYLKDEISELMAMEPDGIFCDCMIPRSCYCPSCIKKMKAKGIDINDDKAVFAFAVDTLLEVFAELQQLVGDKMRLYINSFPYEMISQYESHAELECLPTYRWGYDFLPAQAPYHRNNAVGKELVYMTGRMVTCWGDFSGSKPDAALENDVYDALLYGYYPSVGDNMHPRDGLDQKLFSQVGKMYRYVESLEPWTDYSTPAVEAAILRNKVTYETVLTPVAPSDKGVARMMSELKLCYDVVTEDMDLSKYKLVILPDNITVTDQLNEKLKAFDGAILSTGKSIRKSEVWDYIEDFCEDTNDDAFYRWGGQVYGGKCSGVKLKSSNSLSEYIEPYFNKEFDGIHGYFYVPNDKPAGYCAIAKKGKRAHIAFNIFEAYMEFGALFHRELVKDLIDDLLPQRLIVSENLPSTSRATLRKGTKGDLLHLKVTFPEHWGTRGIIDEHVTLPAGRTVSVMGEYRKVSALPDLKELPSVTENGRTKITLPEICGYMPFLLEE